MVVSVLEATEIEIRDIIEMEYGKKIAVKLENRKGGEYCFNVFELAKELKRKPDVLAIEVKDILDNHLLRHKSIEVVKAYLNIEFPDEFYVELLNFLEKPYLPRNIRESYKDNI